MQAYSYFGLPQQQLTLAAVALFIVFSLYPIYRYLKVKDRSGNTKTSSLANATQTEKPKNLTVTHNTALANNPAKQQLIDSISNTPEISTSDEHTLEIELSAQGHVEPFDDLDHTIAEAEFNVADLTISETRNIAQPNVSSSFSNASTDTYNDASDLQKIIATNGTPKSSATTHNEPLNNYTSDLNNAFTGKLDARKCEIESLAKSNQSLIEIRESLVVELAELKFSLKKSNAVARRSIAQRDRAIEMKNSALTLAAMERKKRKLTEIKARKALLKMRNTLKELTDQTVK